MTKENGRTRPTGDVPTAPRKRRRAEAIIAEYIHELSGRHNGSASQVPNADDGEDR